MGNWPPPLHPFVVKDIAMQTRAADEKSARIRVIMLPLRRSRKLAWRLLWHVNWLCGSLNSPLHARTCLGKKLDSEFWGITYGSLYLFDAVGNKRQEYKLPKLESVSGIRLSKALPHVCASNRR